jgi:two-component system cell cycle response regulator
MQATPTLAVTTLFDDLRSLFISADRAMYEAKARGRNQVVMLQAGTTLETVRGGRAP